MTDQQGSGDGWRPLSAPAKERPQGNLNRRLNLDGSPVATSFVRLARTHAFHAAGDATYAVALVGSIFALDTDAARGRILLYLLLTLAPFALVGPFIGPALDRMQGGRRLMIIATLAARALLMLLLIRNIETFWLFPIAFTQLVMGKTYSVAKAATVPSTVNSEDELVDKNARLAVLGTVAGAVGAAPGLGLQALFGSAPTLVWGFLIYSVGLAAATRLPRVVVDDPEVPDDEVDLRSAGVRLAASAMSVLRGITGFVFWLMVFAFGNNDIDTEGVGKAAGLAVRFALGFSIEGDNSQPAWKLGFVLASIGLGIFLGNVFAPRLRERFTEEIMIVGAIAAILIAAIAAVWAGGLSGAVLLALVVGAAPASAKLAFDSLVQRDAPGANHGAAFGRFETRFQVASVIGSVIAVAPTVIVPVRVGSLIVALAALAAGVLYLVGSRTMRADQGPRPQRPPRAQRQRRSDDAAGGGTPDDEHQQVPQQAGYDQGYAPQEPLVREVYKAPPTTEVQAVNIAPEPDSSAADPYAEAFADRPVEPPDWAAAVFEDQPEDDALLPPQWLDGHTGDPTNTWLPFDDAEGDEPTPPLGTPRVEP